MAAAFGEAKERSAALFMSVPSFPESAGFPPDSTPTVRLVLEKVVKEMSEVCQNCVNPGGLIGAELKIEGDETEISRP
jgi:hypothetical protein